MFTPTSHDPRRQSFRRFPQSRWLLALLLPIAVAVAGCSGKDKGPKGELYGNVTLNGKPVAGSVTFITSDKQEFGAPISPDGSYHIGGIPAGPMKVKVTAGMGGGAGAAAGGGAPGGAAGAGAPPKDLPKMSEGNMTQSQGVAPPAKYSNADNELAFEATGAKQEKNLELKP